MMPVRLERILIFSQFIPLGLLIGLHLDIHDNTLLFIVIFT